ncbi:hypothetical protein GmHk_08G023969 [Glycine max]|uniref:Transmembrane protein n=1 Tax=Glycine max TaxID=3847 RepID=K7LA67_SOYBN|nr:hypothetical protein JHK85_023677 [Glycine max]KAH1054127.1 hypothetical protein GYH30_023072 [Glycine max]KAH1239560.1 hypothetical protein GmHk_08G023969 [Glycine max]
MRKRVANSLNSRDVCNASTPGFKPTPPKNKRKQQLFFFSFSLWVFLFRFALIRGKGHSFGDPIGQIAKPRRKLEGK